MDTTTIAPLDTDTATPTTPSALAEVVGHLVGELAPQVARHQSRATDGDPQCLTAVNRRAQALAMAAVLAQVADRQGVSAEPIKKWLLLGRSAGFRAAVRLWSEISADTDDFSADSIPLDWIGCAYEQLTGKIVRPSPAGPASSRWTVDASSFERKNCGRFFTPVEFARKLAAETLAPALAGPKKSAEATATALRIVDPACGAGAFLLAAIRVLADRAPLGAIVRGGLHGVDRDPVAVAIARSLMWLVAGRAGLTAAEITRQIRLGDAITGPVPGISPTSPPPQPDFALDWRRAFPTVFAGHDRPAGFDVVLGNPPWDKQKTFAREFFAHRRPELHRLPRLEFDRAVETWLATNPTVAAEWAAHQRQIQNISGFIRTCGMYQHLGRGELNVFKVFIERAIQILALGGSLGLVLPYSFCIDLGTTELRRLVFDSATSVTISISDNRSKVFGISSVVNFITLTAHQSAQAAHSTPTEPPKPDATLTQRRNGHAITVPQALVRLISPESLSIPEFSGPADVELLHHLYDGATLLGGPRSNGVEPTVSVRWRREWDMTLDRGRFNRLGHGLPVFEGKMIHQYRLDWAGQPTMPARRRPESEQWIKGKPPLMPDGLPIPRFWIAGGAELPEYEFRCAVRLIQNSRNTRTLIATMLPACVTTGNSLATAHLPSASVSPVAEHLLLVGLLNSHVLDWVIRLKIDANLNLFHLSQLPLPKTDWSALAERIAPRVLAILQSFSPKLFADFSARVCADLGKEWGAVRMHRGRPVAELVAETDAVVAWAYGLSADQLAYIFSAFPRESSAVHQAVMDAFSAI